MEEKKYRQKRSDFIIALAEIMETLPEGKAELAFGRFASVIDNLHSLERIILNETENTKTV